MPTSNDEIIIGEIEKNKTEKLRVSLAKFNGHDLLSLRVWFTKDGTEWRPSDKGLAVNQRLLPGLIQLLEQAQAQVKPKADA